MALRFKVSRAGLTILLALAASLPLRSQNERPTVAFFQLQPNDTVAIGETRQLNQLVIRSLNSSGRINMDYITDEQSRWDIYHLLQQMPSLTSREVMAELAEQRSCDYIIYGKVRLIAGRYLLQFYLLDSSARTRDYFSKTYSSLSDIIHALPAELNQLKYDLTIN